MATSNITVAVQGSRAAGQFISPVFVLPQISPAPYVQVKAVMNLADIQDAALVVQWALQVQSSVSSLWADCCSASWQGNSFSDRAGDVAGSPLLLGFSCTNLAGSNMRVVLSLPRILNVGFSAQIIT